jgi:hypothetical protein
VAHTRLLAAVLCAATLACGVSARSATATLDVAQPAATPAPPAPPPPSQAATPPGPRIYTAAFNSTALAAVFPANMLAAFGAPVDVLTTRLLKVRFRLTGPLATSAAAALRALTAAELRARLGVVAPVTSIPAPLTFAPSAPPAPHADLFLVAGVVPAAAAAMAFLLVVAIFMGSRRKTPAGVPATPAGGPAPASGAMAALAVPLTAPDRSAAGKRVAFADP